MRLKLFRSTGYSTLLMPGETRVAMHPGWLVLATSLWLGFVCNVALWRALSGSAMGTGFGTALLSGALVAGTGGALLSLLGWRRTLKPAATVLLFLGALFACGMWAQAVPVDGGLWGVRPGALMPGWASLLRWQVPALLVGLALLPSFWVWHVNLRRLPGPDQLRANLSGAAMGIVVAAVAALAVLR
jgi:glucan phosphoethanolaminetransferase (alkaline phosphatase superfamily)